MNVVPYLLLLIGYVLLYWHRDARISRAGIICVLASLFLGIIAAPASAADNFPVKDGLGATRTKAAKDIGSGILADRTVLVDASGADVSPATKADQTAPQAIAGSDATKAVAVQGVTNGKAIAVDTVFRGTATDRGAIVGTTAVQLMAANTARRGFSIQNQSGTAVCYISGQATATADYHSLQIPPGTFYATEPTHVGTAAISIICSAAATSVYAREY